MNRAFRFVLMAGAVTTVSMSRDDHAPDVGTDGYLSTLVCAGSNEIEFDEIVSAGRDASAGPTVSGSRWRSLEADNNRAFLDENRVFTGVRISSSETGVAVALP